MMYLLFGIKAISLVTAAQITYVMKAETSITKGVGMPNEFIHMKTGVRANICIRYIP